MHTSVSPKRLSHGYRRIYADCDASACEQARAGRPQPLCNRPSEVHTSAPLGRLSHGYRRIYADCDASACEQAHVSRPHPAMHFSMLRADNRGQNVRWTFALPRPERSGDLEQGFKVSVRIKIERSMASPSTFLFLCG